MKVLRGLLVVLVLLALAVGIAYALSAPEPLPAESLSAKRLDAGPRTVRQSEFSWTDTTRPTAANGDYPGAEERSLKVTMWWPEGAGGPHPLVLYSHGFMSTRHGGAYLAEHLASYGYVVVSADYPLTNFAAPGGPEAQDVVNQPGDLSFLIDQVLALSGEGKPFAGEIDEERMALMGLSLGGLTTTLATFHPEWRDPRVRVAISIAGPSVMFGERYFDHVNVPFLMIAGTADSMIDFEANAVPIAQLVRRGGLLAIEGGTHAGFDQMSSGLMRILGNPDALGCAALMDNLELEPGEAPFEDFGTREQGFVDTSGAPLPCEKSFDEVMKPGRQQMLTTVAVRAFLESHFASKGADRRAHGRFLVEEFPGEMPEVAFFDAIRN